MELFGALDRMMDMEDLRSLSDAALLARMDDLADAERGAVADAVACLAEVNRRDLFGRYACSDLFDYCIRRLRYSAGSAYRRVHAVRVANRNIDIYSDLRNGDHTLTTIARIAQGVEASEWRDALAKCRGKTTREVDAWLASRQPPRPAPPDRVIVRAPLLPEPPVAGQDMALPDAPIAPPREAYEYTFTASAELNGAIERLKDILWSKHPFAALDVYLKVAVLAYVEKHDPGLKLTEARPVKPTAARRVPQGVRDVVWARDGSRCAFVGDGGVRCEARRGLELDHVVPFSLGGRSDDPRNIRLLCREHNQLERRRVLGEGALLAPG